MNNALVFSAVSVLMIIIIPLVIIGSVLVLIVAKRQNDQEQAQYRDNHMNQHTHRRWGLRTGALVLLLIFFLGGLASFSYIRKSEVTVNHAQRATEKAWESALASQSQHSESTINSYIDHENYTIKTIDGQIGEIKKQLDLKQAELAALEIDHGAGHPKVKSLQVLIDVDTQKIKLLETQQAEAFLSLEKWSRELQKLAESEKMKLELKAQNDPQELVQGKPNILESPATLPNSSPVWITGKNLGTKEFLIKSKQFATYEEAVDHAYRELYRSVISSYAAKNNLMKFTYSLPQDKQFLRDHFIINEHHSEKMVDLGNGMNQLMHQVYFLAIINESKVDEVVQLSNKQNINERVYYLQAGIVVITLFYGIAGYLLKN